ncbi:MAG TPA: hypothetical protein PLL75_02170 [Candidatus Omnitrophota bacterium]|nr:hypothetical protein [Candidatus Omnitrophota bacterium]HPS36517.1 hypothetical protein [Candidatus Omnitrophota bacterium]
MRIPVVILSFCFIVFLACAGGAELVFKKGMADKDPELLKIAQNLNPLVSVYFYEDYRLTGNLKTLLHAVRREPTKPAYHMYYGLALLKQKTRTRASDREAVIEICQAACLKPYSAQYQSICEQYKKLIR